MIGNTIRCKGNKMEVLCIKNIHGFKKNQEYICCKTDYHGFLSMVNAYLILEPNPTDKKKIINHTHMDTERYFFQHFLILKTLEEYAI